ncbi:MAG: hypothetical protein Alis2KO_42060 [Aliiglaciecola sp.]
MASAIKKRNLTYLGIVLALVLVAAFIFANPLRQTQSSIEQYVEEVTPLGSSMNDVISAINENGWNIDFVNENKGFYHQDITPNREVGSKSIRAVMGEYRTILVTTSVTVFWGFDEQGKLTDIWVWKVNESL